MINNKVNYIKEMIKRFISFTFTVLASVLLTVSLLLVYSRYKLLQDDYYFHALENVDAYEEFRSVAESTLDEYLKENLKVSDENEFNPTLAARIIRAVLLDDEFYEILQSTIQRNVTNALSWVKSENELILYFPRQEIINKYSGPNGNEIFLNQFLEVLGYQDLPECTTPIEVPLNDIVTGELQCLSPDLENYLEKELLAKANVNTSDIVEGFLDSTAPLLDEEIVVFEDFNRSPGNTPEMIQNAVRSILLVGIGGVCVSLLVAGLSALFSKTPALSFLKVFLNSGIFLIIFSLVGKIAFRILADFFLWGRISPSPDVFSEEQADMILGLLKSIYGALVDRLLLEIIVMGAVLITIFVGFLILFRFTRVIKSSEVEEEEDYDEGDDVDENSQVEKNSKHFESDILEQTPTLKD